MDTQSPLPTPVGGGHRSGDAYGSQQEAYELDQSLRKRAVFAFPKHGSQGKGPRLDKKKPLSVFYHCDEKVVRRAKKHEKLSISKEPPSFEKMRIAELKVRLAQKNLLDSLYGIVVRCGVASPREYLFSLDPLDQLLLAATYCESTLFQAEILAQGFCAVDMSEEVFAKLQGPAQTLCATLQAVRSALRRLALTGEGGSTATEKGKTPKGIAAVISPKLSRARFVSRNKKVSGKKGDMDSSDSSLPSSPVLTRANMTGGCSGDLQIPVITTGEGCEETAGPETLGHFAMLVRMRQLDSDQGPPAVFTPLLGLLRDFDVAWARAEELFLRHTALVGEPEAHTEQKQLVAVLMSEGVQYGLRAGHVTRSDVDNYEPHLMFAIPRLAIVRGLAGGGFWADLLTRTTDGIAMLQDYASKLVELKGQLSSLSESELIELERHLCAADGDASGFAHQDLFLQVSRVADRMHSSEQAKDLGDILNRVFAMNQEDMPAPSQSPTPAFGCGLAPLTVTNIRRSSSILSNVSNKSAQQGQRHENRRTGDSSAQTTRMEVTAGDGQRKTS